VSDSTPIDEELWTTIQCGREWHGEATRRRKNGTSYVAEMRIAPIEDAHGAASG